MYCYTAAADANDDHDDDDDAISLLLTGGYYNTHIPQWFQWMRYLSFISYTLSALAEVEYTMGDPFLYVFLLLTIM